MQSRRRFFGHLGVLIAASVAPNVFLPSSPVGWKPTYRQVRRLTKAVWTPELIQDLQMYHSIDAEKELNALLNYYVEQEFPDAEIVRIEKGPLVYTPMTFTPRSSVYAVVMERV